LPAPPPAAIIEENMAEHRDPGIREGTDLAEKTRLQAPRLYRVMLLNDDYTTMDFVVKVIVAVFHRSASEATRIMLDVHRKGRGVVGTYTRDIAMTKVAQVHELARENEFPLRATAEEA
jgi:ATP-dependent Clp protease adaptor protein ClpS